MRMTLILTIFLVLATSFSFAKGSQSKGKVVSGGNTKPKYVVGLNFVGGKFGGGRFNSGAEAEIDIGLSSKISIAPRLGLADFDVFAPGASLRFGIIGGKRPHGFWIGPSLDFFFFNNRGNRGNQSKVVITPAGEFGWRYTFDFNLSLQALTRVGFFAGDGSGFFWALGVGVGYAF